MSSANCGEIRTAKSLWRGAPNANRGSRASTIQPAPRYGKSRWFAKLPSRKATRPRRTIPQCNLRDPVFRSIESLSLENGPTKARMSMERRVPALRDRHKFAQSWSSNATRISPSSRRDDSRIAQRFQRWDQDRTAISPGGTAELVS